MPPPSQRTQPPICLVPSKRSELLDLLVPRDRRQLGHVPQQDAAALEIEDRFLAPGLKLAVDALAGGADEDAELLLRDVHLRAEIGGERAEAPREANRQRLEHGLFHALALPADALAQQRDDLDPDLRLALEESEKVFAPQHEQFAGFAAVASAVRLWPSSTATSPKRSPGPMKFRVRRLPSEAPVSIRIWPRRTP